MHILYIRYIKVQCLKDIYVLEILFLRNIQTKKSSSVVHLKVIIMSLLYVHVLFVEKNYYAMNLKRFDLFFY